jgi:hypothetical protein
VLMDIYYKVIVSFKSAADIKTSDETNPSVFSISKVG